MSELSSQMYPTCHSLLERFIIIIIIITCSHVCGRGNVFIVSVCVSVCVCLSVWAITFEPVDIEASFLV